MVGDIEGNTEVGDRVVLVGEKGSIDLSVDPLPLQQHENI